MQLVFTPRISHQVPLELMSVFAVMGRHMKCKSDQIRTAWMASDQVGALRIAARFFDRSIDTKIFKRAWDAYNNPDFYRQLGKNPEQIVREALDVLAKRFNLYRSWPNLRSGGGSASRPRPGKR